MEDFESSQKFEYISTYKPYNVTNNMAYKNKEDQLRVQREWYSRNKKNRSKEIYQRKLKLKKFVDAIRDKLSCERCGESDSICIDFHHTNSDDKIDNINRMINRGFSKENILLEIEKCIPLCSNCHRKEHRNLKRDIV